MKKSTRIIALILCALMLLSLLSAIASAEEDNSAELDNAEEAEAVTEPAQDTVTSTAAMGGTAFQTEEKAFS